MAHYVVTLQLNVPDGSDPNTWDWWSLVNAYSNEVGPLTDVTVIKVVPTSQPSTWVLP